MTAPPPRLAGAQPVPYEARASVRHLPAWAAERFPARNVVLFGVLCLTMAVVARATAPGLGEHAVALGARDVALLAALTAFFLVLRVLDEHKDFAADAVAHPGRVLQRGLVTLRALRVVGVLAAAITLAVTLNVPGEGGVTVLAWWLAVAAWSALMAREFFAREWLRRRIGWYALSHMLVMPLATGWMMALAAPAGRSGAAVAAMMLLSFLASLVVEIARKVRGPADEHPLADSYTQSLGIARAMLLLVGAGLAAALVSVLLVQLVAGEYVRLAPVAWLPAATAFALVLAAAARFRARPSAAHAKQVEGLAGLAMLIIHLAIIGAALAAHGVTIA